jgi:hypothetical protein
MAPDMLAQENGKEGMAEVSKEWLVNKNSDLREREGTWAERVGRRRMVSYEFGHLQVAT